MVCNFEFFLVSCVFNVLFKRTLPNVKSGPGTFNFSHTQYDRFLHSGYRALILLNCIFPDTLLKSNNKKTKTKQKTGLGMQLSKPSFLCEQIKTVRFTLVLKSIPGAQTHWMTLVLITVAVRKFFVFYLFIM